MTPSASASPIVLLAPAAAPAGASAGTEITPAPALDGGFQLLVDAAAQQQLAAQLAGSAPKPQLPTVAEGGGAPAEAGNVLPPPGLILPFDDGQPVVGEQGDKKADDTDKDESALPVTASTTTIPLPWVPVNIQPQQPAAAKSPGSHATKDADSAIETSLDATSKAAGGVALAPLATNAQPAAAGNDAAAAAATAAAADSGIQLGVAGMTAPTPRQSGAERTAQPSFDALAGSSADGTQAIAAGDGAGARKGGEVASFADALKPAVAAAADAAQPPASTVGAVDAGRSHAPTRSYLDVNNATTAAAVSVPVGSNGWSDAVVDKVMWFSANQINSAEIKLNPPDLGPLHVRISTQPDQTTSVVFSSPHAAVRDALDQALPRLRDMFGGQGLQLSDASVGGQAQRQQQQGDNNPSAQNRNSGWFGGEDGGDAPVAVSRVGVGGRLSSSAVDAYA